MTAGRIGRDTASDGWVRVQVAGMGIASYDVTGDGYPDGFERGARRRYQRDLREIGGRLGAVRDLDVLVEILSAYEAQRSDRGRAGLRPIRDAWVAEREARRVELIDLLGSEAFARFFAEYEEFTGTEGLAAVPVPPHSPGLVRTRMPATAWAAYQAVWAFDDHLGRADLTTLHQLRIAGKWLRYTLEFARDALEPEATPLIRRVVVLQDRSAGTVFRQSILSPSASIRSLYAGCAPA